jgi:hypothetical protein
VVHHVTAPRPSRCPTSPALFRLGPVATYLILLAWLATLGTQQALAGTQPVRLAEEPIRLDAPGIILRVPEGAVIESRTLAGRSVATIALPDALGTILVQSERADAENPDARALPTADETAEALIRSALGIRPESRFDPLRDRPSTPRGRFLGPGPAVAAPAGGTTPLYAEIAGDPPVLRGVAVFQPLPDRSIVIDLLATAARGAEARATFEVVLSTVVSRDAGAASRTRELARREGAARLARLSDDRFAAIIESFSPTFERLYRPATDSSPAVERGYRRTAARLGQRGEVSGKPRDRWTQADLDAGFIVTVDARLLGETGERIDSRATYFLADDRRNETWSVTMSVRSDGPTTVWTEIGAREGRQLTVNIAQGRNARRSVTPSIRVEGFLSRVESLLLPRLLATTGQTGTFTYAVYDSQREAVVERTETLGRTARGWSLETVYEDGRSQTAEIDPAGVPVRTQLDSGLVWEPITFDRLYQIWNAKGLPLN